MNMVKTAAEYWGRNGAGVILQAPTGRILLLKRSNSVMDPNMWGIPGGRVEKGSTPQKTVHDEVGEEIGAVDMKMSPTRPHMFKAPDADFRYGTFLAHVPSEFEPKLNSEHTGHTWVHPHNVEKDLDGSPVHPNVISAISHHFPKENRNGSKVSMRVLKKYIKLANLLDNSGCYDAARVIDKFIKKAQQESLWSNVLVSYGLGANNQHKAHTKSSTGNSILEALKKIVKSYELDYGTNIESHLPDGIESFAEMLEGKAKAHYEKTGGTYKDGSFYMGFEWPSLDGDPRRAVNCELYITPLDGKKTSQASLEVEMEKEVEEADDDDDDDKEKGKKKKKKKITLSFD